MGSRVRAQQHVGFSWIRDPSRIPCIGRREKQQKVVLPEPCQLPSFQAPEPLFGGLLPSVSRVSAQNPRSGQGSPGLSAGLGALHGHSLWPRHGNLPGSSAALDSDLASPYRKRRGDRCGEQWLLVIVVCGLLFAVSPLIVEHRLQVCELQWLWLLGS
ncbi:hypothetical protein MJT46_019014 [Ovis ammon polii x Ovis aries]|nr:hypothetical protein MJT46_019014 [Ovis ammon polii x Ovis aries]